MNLYKEIIVDKDPVVRSGAVNMISMAYVNTSAHEVIDQLLQIAATDLSNDVRR